MKVHINRTPVVGPWGGGNMWVKAAYDLFPQFEVFPVRLEDDPDVILLAGLSGDDNDMSAMQAMDYKRWASSRGRKVKLVLRVNENDARKGTKGVDETIYFIGKHMDSTVFVSKWLSDYFESSAWPGHTCHIHNGVDRDIFKPSTKASNGKVNIVTHHWSDNYMKGFDVYDVLDQWVSKHPDFTFTYIGRARNSFKNSRVVPPIFGRDLGEELGKYDVYVSASRFDPGPNHIIESIACGIPTYVHKDGGGCVEFAGDDHVYSDVDEVLNILETKKYASNDAWAPPTWRECIGKFSDLVKGMT